MTKKTANERSISFFDDLTLEKWHKLAPTTQYKYTLLARTIRDAGGRNFLRDIGVPLESSLKSLKKAHEDYLQTTKAANPQPIAINEQSGNQSPDFSQSTQESLTQSTQSIANESRTSVRRTGNINLVVNTNESSGRDSQTELSELRSKIGGLEEYIKYLEYIVERCQIEMKQRSEIFEMELRYRDQGLARLTAQLQQLQALRHTE